MQTGILLVRSDRAASLSIDGKIAGDIEADGFLKVSAVAGEHFIDAREKDGGCKWEKKITIPVGMQVAEVVDFTECASNQDTGPSTPTPAIVAPPLIIPPPTAVDPKIQEAQDLHERGCRLYFLDRDTEAIPLLENAASVIPDTGPLGCLNMARVYRSNAQRLVDDNCGNQQTSNDPVKKQKQEYEKQQQLCRLAKMQVGVKLGDLGGFSYLNYLIQEGEQSRNAFNSPDNYKLRAMYEYALGNPTSALNDLQISLDGTRRYWENCTVGTVEQREMNIGMWESDIYLKRAIIQTNTGNNDAAAQDCRMALASKYFINKSEREFCTRMATAPAESDSGQHGISPNSSNDAHSVDDAIDRIRGGQYAPMPPAQASVGSGSGSPRLTIENDTQYELRVYLSGPETHSVSIPAGGSSVLDLTIGTFKLAAEIPNSSILPFYGEQTFNNGTAYMEKFYIQRVQ